MTDGRLEEIMDEGDMIVTQPSNEHPYEVDPNTSVSNNLIQSSPIDRSSQQLYVLDSTRGILFPLQAANQPVIASFGIEHQQGTEYHTVQLEAGEKENNPEEDPRSEEVISTSKQIIDAAAVFSPSEQDINATEAIAASTIPISPSKFKVKSQIKSQNRLIPWKNDNMITLLFELWTGVQMNSMEENQQALLSTEHYQLLSGNMKEKDN